LDAGLSGEGEDIHDYFSAWSSWDRARKVQVIRTSNAFMFSSKVSALGFFTFGFAFLVSGTAADGVGSVDMFLGWMAWNELLVNLLGRWFFC
jgi:hypothetical protein